MEGENNQNQDVKKETSESKHNLPVQVGSSNKLQVREKVSIAGLRPIAASNLQVVETVNIMGIRPITANTVDVVETINVSGIRPIAASGLVIGKISMTPWWPITTPNGESPNTMIAV